MHHVRVAFRNKVAFSNYQPFKECGDSFLLRNTSCRRSFPSLTRYFCSGNRKDDGDNAKTETSSSSKPVTVKGGKSGDAKAKLNSLLQTIVKENQEASASAADKKAKENVVDMRLAKPIVELLEQPNEPLKPQEEIEAERDLGKEMVTAVKKVAEIVSEGDSKAVESELVQKLKTSVGKKINMTELFEGMRIDRSKPSSPSTSPVDVDLSRAHRVRRLLSERSFAPEKKREVQSQGVSRQRRSPPSKTSYVPIDLFGGPNLGIFTDPSQSTEESALPVAKQPKLNTWDALNARDLKLAVTHPPGNGFEEMILWTEQGKLWKFPIDNEQGWEEEAKVPFHEHVFLEHRIEEWCPKKGPIRHFMELVCIGLSKNPFITVQEKHKQIEWYHQYFKGKSDIIKEVGAGEIK